MDFSVETFIPLQILLCLKSGISVGENWRNTHAKIKQYNRSACEICLSIGVVLISTSIGSTFQTLKKILRGTKICIGKIILKFVYGNTEVWLMHISIKYLCFTVCLDGNKIEMFICWECT